MYFIGCRNWNMLTCDWIWGCEIFWSQAVSCDQLHLQLWQNVGYERRYSGVFTICICSSCVHPTKGTFFISPSPFSFVYLCVNISLWVCDKGVMWMMKKRRNLINSSKFDDENFLLIWLMKCIPYSYTMIVLRLKIAHEELLYFAELKVPLWPLCWQSYITLIYIVRGNCVYLLLPGSWC